MNEKVVHTVPGPYLYHMGHYMESTYHMPLKSVIVICYNN